MCMLNMFLVKKNRSFEFPKLKNIEFKKKFRRFYLFIYLFIYILEYLVVVYTSRNMMI